MNDIALLKLIEKQARLSVKDLAILLEENEQDIDAALTKLEKEKVICGYHTLINWDKSNYEKVMALIEVSAIPSRNVGYDEVANKIVQYPEVDDLYLMSGGSEFIVIINGKTMQEVASFVGRKLAPIEGVKGTTTHFVLKRYKVNGTILDENQDRQERMIVL